MSRRQPHEPAARVMSAADVWDDAERLAELLRSTPPVSEPHMELDIPLSAFLAALDGLSRDELLVLRQRLDERLSG